MDKNRQKIIVASVSKILTLFLDVILFNLFN